MDKRNIKSQSSIEFMIFVSIIIVVFIIILGIVSQRLIEINKQREEVLANDLLISLQKELNLATKVEDGYFRSFKIPLILGNKLFQLVNQGNELAVVYENIDYEIKIPYFDGNLTLGNNFIRKQGGIVYVNK